MFRLGAVALFTALTSLAPAVHAQTLKMASISYEAYQPSTVENATPGGPASDRSIRVARAELAYPLFFNDGATMLLPSLRYHYIDMGSRNATPENATKLPFDGLHAAMLNVAVMQRVTKWWSLIGSPGIGFASDTSGGPTGDDLVLSASLISLFEVTPTLTLGAGAAVNYRPGNTMVFPLLPFDWQPTTKVAIQGMLPMAISARYRLLEPLTVALEGSLEYERYNVDPEKFGAHRAHIQSTALKGGPALIIHLSRMIHLHPYGGLATGRKLEYFLDGESAEHVTLRGGWYGGLELWFGTSGYRADMQ
ncbi:DUF6268 family outer membrane beta-barrel protein [Pendulispora rubella]|uniref:DUF6268 family outer membrane beta-barrel protein n=1 Tax=Pendulispora rubella TaxID=2741070 RepID=A0ABZ2KSI0_9BACT